MFNELLWLSFAFIDLIVTIILFRYFGKIALYCIIVFNLILCNIQVLKTIELFGLTTTLGNILYAGVFLATDILSEFYGKKEATKAVIFGFIALALATIYMQVALLYIPDSSDFIQPHLEAIFSFLPRVTLASLLAYLVSQMHDVWSFHFIKQKTNGKMLWLRNNVSTMFSQLLDSVIFCSIAFYGVFPLNIVIEILLSTYLIKLIVAFLDTPFIYLSKIVYNNYLKTKTQEQV